MRQTSEERRRYPRSRRALHVRTADDSGPGVLNHVDNISANGVLCHTVKPLALMARIAIALDLPVPGGHRIDAEGIVVRCDPDEQGDDNFRVAILFNKLSDTDRKALQEFVEQDLTNGKTED